jgi:hypothetical protein
MSLAMRGNTEGGPGNHTEGFDDRLDGRNGIAAVDSGGDDFYLVHDGLEHEEENVGVGRCCRDKKVGPRLLS